MEWLEEFKFNLVQKETPDGVVPDKNEEQRSTWIKNKLNEKPEWVSKNKRVKEIDKELKKLDLEMRTTDLEVKLHKDSSYKIELIAQLLRDTK